MALFNDLQNRSWNLRRCLFLSGYFCCTLFLFEGNAYAQKYDKIAPNLPAVSSPTERINFSSQIEGDASKEEQDGEVISSLKGMFLTDKPQKRTPSIKSGSPLNADDLPLLNDPVIKSRLNEYLNKPLTFKTLKSLSKTIVDWYREKDQPLVNVVFPEQDINNGILKIVVVEYVVGQVKVDGNKWFKASQIRNAVRLKEGDKIVTSDFEQDLAYINQNPFRHVDAVFSKGKAVGTTDVFLKTTDRNPMRIYAGYDNSGSKLTGRSRWNEGVNYGNVAGLGHILSYQFSSSSDFWNKNGKVLGGFSDPRYMGHSLSYTIPLMWRDQISLYGYYSRSRPSIDANFHQVGKGGQASFRYVKLLPLSEILSHQVQLGYDFKTTNNNLEFNGVQISNTMADINQFTVGYRATVLDSYGQTVFENNFFYSPGGLTKGNRSAAFEQTGVSHANAHYIYDKLEITRQTPLWWKTVWQMRFQTQLSTSNLLSSEQIGGAGLGGVRGYENGQTGSKGVVVNQELKLPAFSVMKSTGLLSVRDEMQPFVFWDYAKVADVKSQENADKRVGMQSVGFGLNYAMDTYLTARVDMGQQLNKMPGTSSRGRYTNLSLTLSY